MKRSLISSAVLALLVAVTGCSTAGQTPVQGLAFGASGAAQRPELPRPAAGSALIAALNGGILDEAVAAQLNPAERNKALQAEYRTLEHTPAGESVAWDTGGRGYNGEVEASQPYRVGSQDCRQYTHKVVAEGVPLETRGTACRNGDGSWTPLT